jgi:PAS domain S-box-containing protein
VSVESALGASEEQYRRLFETCGDAIFVLDSSGRIQAANPAAVRMHGYTEAELQGLNVRDLDGTTHAQHVPARIQRLLAGEDLAFEVIHRRKDGTVFPLEVVATRMQRGDESYILEFARDITERKPLAFAALR